jgi:general stress protein YciG
MPNNNNGRGRGGSSRRGFAAMSEERQREIASQGGKAAHASGNAHEFTSDEAREAGRKGGRSRQRNSRNGNNRGGGRM